PDMILGSVKASKLKTMKEVIEFTTELMEDKTRAYAERQADNKRKSEDIAGNNQNHQPNKRQNTGQAYTAGNGDKKFYAGFKPLCSKGNGCFECGNPGYFKRDCPKLKNKNGENRNAQGWVYVVGNAERNGNTARNPDSNVVTDTFLLNNRYASILFDTGADRSFVSTAFSSLIDIIPTPLVNHYDVKLADGKIISATQEDDKPEGKQVKDVPIFQDFPEVFPENLP
nr:hypothetical protein [Tanacetum cinerariifolium]